MNAPHAKQIDRRLDRRIPLGCQACIVAPGGQRLEATCIELSVGGMTLHTRYVPAASEVIEVMVASPGSGSAVLRPPLHAKLRVLRCHPLGDGRYELGGEIVTVLG